MADSISNINAKNISNINDIDKNFLQPVVIVNNNEGRVSNSEICNVLKLDSNQCEISLIEPDKTATISVDQIRNVIEEVSKKNINNKIRVFIITDTGNMKDVAQNSMLKILEEPSEKVQLVLITKSSEDLLKTILSRCRVIKIESTISENINIFDESFLLSKALQSKEDKKDKNNEKLVWKDENLYENMIELQCMTNKLSTAIDEQKLAKLWLFYLWQHNK